MVSAHEYPRGSLRLWRSAALGSSDVASRPKKTDVPLCTAPPAATDTGLTAWVRIYTVSSSEIMNEAGRKSRATIGLVFFLSVVCCSFLSSAGDPDRVFSTLKTEHFNIHYENGLDHTARLTAALAEEIHDDLSILFGWEVKKRTEVVITDAMDSANGSASVIGKPVIRLYATAPSLDSALQSHDHWLRTLFVHEYTHIVHLNIRGAFPDVINSVFGDVYLPNQFSPRWLIEGLAVLVETHQTSAGRIRSSLYQMYIRTAALEDTLLNLGQVSNTTREYLRGSHSYIYGAMFMEYIYQKYGMEKIVEFCHQYGDSVIPYGINRLFKKIFGQDVQELYDEWVLQMNASATRMKQELAKTGITESIALTYDGEDKGPPIFEPGDRSILLPIGNGMDETAVYRVFTDGSKKKGIVYSNASSRISKDRTGRIFYTRSAPYKNYYSFQDLFVLEGEDAAPRRLTFGKRARYAAVSPRGDKVVMTVNDAGTSKLILADEQGQTLSTLIDSKRDNQVFDPTWSPDGKSVVAVVREEANVDLVYIDMTSFEVTSLTNDRFIESAPSFSPDGRYLVFTSDRSGIANVYAWDFQEAKLLQITNILTGAFAPAVSNDGKTLAFLKYSSKGYDLHTTSFSPTAAPPATMVADTFEPARPLPEIKPLLSRPYNPFPSMIPSYWMLNTQLDNEWNVALQAVTAFSDVTGKHYLGGDVLYQTEQQTVSGRVGYSYSGIGPSVHLGFSRQFLPQETGYRYEGEDKDWMQILTRGSLSMRFPVFDVDSGHSLSVGYDVVHAKPRGEITYDLDPRGDLPTVPSPYFRAGLSLAWGFSDVVSSPMGIGPHKGRSISAGVDLYHPAFGGDQELASFTYRWSEYLPMPWLSYHTLAMSLSGAANISNPPNQVSYSMGGQSDTNIVDTIINNQSNGVAPLRGYPPSQFKGSHYHLLKINYRFPLWFTEAAYSTIPVFMRRIQGSVFTDNALISFGEFNRDDWKSSVGAEVAWVFNIGYYQGLSIRTGYAYGLMDGGIHEFIFVISGGI